MQWKPGKKEDVSYHTVNEIQVFSKPLYTTGSECQKPVTRKWHWGTALKDTSHLGAWEAHPLLVCRPLRWHWAGRKPQSEAVLPSTGNEDQLDLCCTGSSQHHGTGQDGHDELGCFLGGPREGESGRGPAAQPASYFKPIIFHGREQAKQAR